jgi:uncharacterized membrane protein HdeD (DUF308 family)
MLNVVSRKWWVLLLRGIAFIVLGVIAMMWPGIPLTWLVWLFAAFCLIDGAASIVLGMRGEPNGTIWWTMIVLGVLAIAGAILAISMPGITLLLLLSIVAYLAILRGIFEIIAAIRLRKDIDDEWVLGLSGAASVLFGILLLSRPGAGLLVMAIMIGAYMTAIGMLTVALSLRLRRVQHKIVSSTP